MRRRSRILEIVALLLCLLVLAGGIAFVMYYTNNLSTDMTTFYVQYGATEIRRDTSMKFEEGIRYMFKVEYPLGFPDNEKGERYKVSVEVTEKGKTIEYSVDDRFTTLYPKSPDVGGSFEIIESTDSFTFCIPKKTTLESILAKAYEGKVVTDIPEVDLTENDYFALIVRSYDGKQVIRIGFGFVQKEAAPSVPESSEK